MTVITELVLAAALFVGAHFGLSSLPIRQPLVRKIGERAAFGVYSLIALTTFAWMLWAYARAPYVALWTPEPWTRWVPFVAMPPGLLLLTAGYSTPNPLVIGMHKAYAAADPAPGLLKVTRHPIMWGIALWALSHLVANGDAASVVLFGALALLALGGAAHSEYRHRVLHGPNWERFARATSYLPFAAVLAGRAQLRFADIGWGRVLVALVAFLVLLLLHGPLIGVPAWPG